MRLTTQQIASIKQVAAEVFGGTAKIYLFGSRVDDQRIDLVLAPQANQAVMPIHRMAQQTGVLL